MQALPVDIGKGCSNIFLLLFFFVTVNKRSIEVDKHQFQPYVVYTIFRTTRPVPVDMHNFPGMHFLALCRQHGAEKCIVGH